MKKKIDDLQRRLDDLEKKAGIEQPIIDVIMWSVGVGWKNGKRIEIGDSVGLYGHKHIGTNPRPCTDEEEIALMREHYEGYLKKFPDLKFSDHLEKHDRLGHPSRKDDRRKLVEKIRKEEVDQ